MPPSSQPAIPHDPLRFLEQQLNIGICWVGLADKRMIWSDGIYDLFDYDRDITPCRAALLDRMHPIDRKDREKINVALQRRISFDDTFRIILRDRRIRWMRTRGEFLFDECGQPNALLVLMVDITAEHNQHDLLYTKTSHVQAIARLSGATVVTASSLGKVTGVLYQQPFSGDAQALGTQSIDWIHPDDRAMLVKALQEAVNQGRDFEGEARICISPHSPVWRRFKATPLRSQDGTIIEWLGLSFDIDHERTGQALMNEFRPVTGAQFRAARSLLRLSVQRLSELTGVSIAVIRRLEELDGVSKDSSGESRRLRAELERQGAVFIFPKSLKPTATLR